MTSIMSFVFKCVVESHNMKNKILKSMSPSWKLKQSNNYIGVQQVQPTLYK
jgi:hypothetical protein